MAEEKKENYTIYVDTGGTFSDAILVTGDGSITTGKSDTTYDNLADCFFESISNACNQRGLSLKEALSRTIALGYGTTIGTNIMVSGHGGPRVGFLTTRGEEDRIFITRRRSAGLTRTEAMHMIAAPTPEVLIPRRLVWGISERLDSMGEEIVPLDEEDVRQAVRALLNEKVEGIAVGFLWSFLNPAHERRVAQVIEEMCPGMPVSLSSEVAPIVREYPRFMSTIIDVYIGRPLRELLTRMENTLRGHGYGHPLLVETAVGGVCPSKTVRPANTLHSGPVGGLAGVDFLRKVYGYPKAIGSDVGGTSFDVSVSTEGAEEFLREPLVGRYEVANPMREILTIGAGGGSIAWVEPVTHGLRVGPHSAGSTPGPVCYGRGGTQPTVTDADVVMNRIDPDFFLGGARKLDVEASRKAVKEIIAQPLGISVEDAAEKICDIIDGSMGALLKATLARYGVNPNESILFAFGGAGPGHCAGYSRGLNFSKVVIPPYAACFCAFGASTSDIKHRYETSPFIIMTHLPYHLASRKYELDQLNSLEQIPPWVVERFNRMFEELENKSYADLKLDGFTPEQASLRAEMLARYIGQLSEISAPCPVRRINSVEDLRKLIGSFETRYEEIYGTEALSPAGGVEILSITLTVSVALNKPRILKYESAGPDPQAAFKKERQVYFGGKWVKTKVYGMEKLRSGNRVGGPSVIEAKDTTVVVPPGFQAAVDKYRYIILEEE